MGPDDGLDLGPFVAATRRELDRAARRQRSAEIPPAPARPRRAPRVGLLVAAAVVLVGAAVVAATRGDFLTSGVRASASEAEHHAEPRGPTLVSPRALVPSRPARELAPPASTPASTPASEPTVGAPAATITGSEPAAAEAVVPDELAPAPTTRSRPTTSAELQQLDAEAQRRWHAGDLAGAEALFLEIVDKGGRTSYAELAFGDLFTLASQAGDARREQQRWKRYLARFPRGRFADDVRAWQCRRATAGDAVACWDRYLEDWPNGTYRAEARRATGSEGSP
jgi:hypothetical protein